MLDGLAVFRFNHLSNHCEWVERAMTTYAINFAASGSLVFEDQILTAPVAFWTWPDHTWRYGAHAGEKSWDHRFISWRGPRTQAWIDDGLFPDHHPARAWRIITDTGGFRRAFDRTLELLAGHPPDHPRVVYALEGVLLELAMQPPGPPPSVGLHARVARWIGAVHEHPEEDWDVTDLASRCGCTPVHLRRLWRQRTGRSPMQDLTFHRLAAAARLLRESDDSLGAIADACGWRDLGYFSRLFSRAHGLPPQRYRLAYRSVE